MQQPSTVTRPASALGKAIAALRPQEHELRVFPDHGAVPLHNNLPEPLRRRPVVGRKSWPLEGSEGAAKAAAPPLTWIGSCRPQGLEPHVWLSAVLGTLAAWPASPVRELTPKAWREARAATNTG